MSGDRRVVLTGIGMVTPLGAGLAANLDALEAGTMGIGPVAAFDARGFALHLAGEVHVDVRAHFRVPKTLKLTDRPTRFAVAAAAMALADAAWPASRPSREGLGVMIGRSGSDLQADALGAALGFDPEGRAVTDIPLFAARILSGLNPLWLLVNLPNMTSAHVAIQLEARGPVSTIMSDWPAGHQALAEARAWIANGEAEAVMAGGTDTGVLPIAYAAYQQSGLFDRDRGGTGDPFVPGEGATLFLLEEHGHATARGVESYGEIGGAGVACGESPDESPAKAAGTLVRTMRLALEEAGWRPAEVSAVVSDAGFSPPSRCAEQTALVEVFGRSPCLVRPPACRSRMGHLLAAAGPTSLAVEIGSASGAPANVLCNSLGPSGQAATLAITMTPGSPGRRARAHPA